jgi:hypothetical protein
MKNVFKYYSLLFALSLISCNKEVEKPKVIYNNSSKTKVAKAAMSQIQLADLPIQMPGTDYLIHPIADLNIFEKSTRNSYESASNANERNFKISNYSEYEITGYLRNLKFQKIGTDSIKPLSDKPMLIQTATFLKSIFDKEKQQIMVYTLADMDTNKDAKLDENDIKTLYISEISGNRLTKMSVDFEELIDWNLMESTSRLYFRTIGDTNKNGKFDQNDVIHYHFVDLSGKDWKVLDYAPI